MPQKLSPVTNADFNPGEIAGLHYDFEYVALKRRFSRKSVSKFCDTARKHHRANLDAWSTKLNTEWLARHYLAVKMLLSASVMVTSLKHAAKTNLQVVEPYLGYYAVLSAARGLLLTDPAQAWNPAVHWKHSKIINLSKTILARFDNDFGAEANRQMWVMKDWRETFSYKFPASGPDLRRRDDPPELDLGNIIDLCQILAEASQLSSQVLHAALDAAGPSLDVDKTLLQKACAYTINGEELQDGDDFYRLDYISRKMRRPFALDWMATEGMVEDYFGSWCAPEDPKSSELFDPDDDWRVIFPFR